MTNAEEPSTPERRPGEPLFEPDETQAAVPVDADATLRHDVVEREREHFGGMRFWSAFFGWLTATGTAVILTALVAAAGAAVGLAANGSPSKAANVAGANANTIGIAGIIALIIVLFVAYFCGGYVAGRMARFDGLKQGLAVSTCGIAIGVAAALATTSLFAQSLFHVSATDPRIYTAVIIVLTLAAMVASWVPARRAARVEPSIALRCE